MPVNADTIPGSVEVPLWVLILALAGLCSAIVYLVLWIRALYAERLKESQAEVVHRDKLLERVLEGVAKLGSAVEYVLSSSSSPSSRGPQQ